MNEKPQHIAMQTSDGRQLAMDALAKVIPSCFTEVKGDDGELHQVVDFTKLRQLLGDTAVDDAPEVYDFTWVGKRAAMQEAAAPIKKTLRPYPKESVDWDTTKNLYIEGDNLEVLKLLQNSYMGKVKMIYIDPPYNTGNDFVYQDDFHRTIQEEDEAAGVFNEQGHRLIRNTLSNGKFHSDWCSMIFSRLLVARSLLKENGVIFISIDDNEVENLRKICDEIFGSSNFIAQFTWKKKQGGGNDSNYVVAEHEYIICFAKNIEKVYIGLDKKYKLDDNLYPFSDEKGDYGLITLDKASIQFSQSLVFEIKDKEGNSYYPRVVKGKQSCWRWGKAKVEKQFDELVFKNGKVYTKYYRPEGVTPRSLLIDAIYGRTESGNDDIKELFPNNPFSYPKPVALVNHFVSIGTQKGDVILDFFSGSATTAQSIFNINAEDNGQRKFILIQLPELTEEKSVAFKSGYKTICDIGKERIRRAGFKILNDLKSKAESLDSIIDKMLSAKPSEMVRLMNKEQQKELVENIYKETIFPKQKELNNLREIIDNFDIGFRVFKCDESNYKDVAFSPKDYSQESLDLFVDNIKDGRSDLDLLFDCMLRWGVELSMPLKSIKVDDCTIHNVDDGNLVACFDGVVTEKVIDAIAAMSPVRVVFRDSSFTEAAAKMNLFELFKQKCNWTEEEVRKNIRVI